MIDKAFESPIAVELHGFLQFKRSLGFEYKRAEYAMREFDRYLCDYAKSIPRWQLDRVVVEQAAA